MTITTVTFEGCDSFKGNRTNKRQNEKRPFFVYFKVLFRMIEIYAKNI